MSTVRATGTAVEIRLSLAEEIDGLVGDLTLPRAAIRSVEVVDDGLAADRGLRAPGLTLPGVVKTGTRRRRGGKDFALVRRGVPASRSSAAGSACESVLVSTPDAAAVAAGLTSPA